MGVEEGIALHKGAVEHKGISCGRMEKERWNIPRGKEEGIRIEWPLPDRIGWRGRTRGRKLKLRGVKRDKTTSCRRGRT